MSSERGIFDGDLPISLTSIFDGSGTQMFDTELSLPTARDPIFIAFHGTDDIPTPFHGRESIILR